MSTNASVPAVPAIPAVRRTRHWRCVGERGGCRNERSRLHLTTRAFTLYTGTTRAGRIGRRGDVHAEGETRGWVTRRSTGVEGIDGPPTPCLGCRGPFPGQQRGTRGTTQTRNSSSVQDPVSCCACACACSCARACYRRRRVRSGCRCRCRCRFPKPGSHFGRRERGGGGRADARSHGAAGG